MILRINFYSPYIGIGNNPINGVDPDGGEEYPIFDFEGNLLGTSESGWEGQAYFMDISEFTEGMSDAVVEFQGTKVDDYAGFVGKVKGMVLTEILNARTGFDPSELYGGVISVGGSLPRYNFNDPRGGDGFWETGRKDGKIHITAWDYNYETTVENIWSVGYDHEYYTHGLSRINHPNPRAYDNQFTNSIWSDTTPRFKRSVLMSLETSFLNVGQKMPDKYRPMYDKFVTGFKPK